LLGLFSLRPNGRVADRSKKKGKENDGTHMGNFLGYPATGNAFAMRSIDIWLVKDGRFVEHWDELNTLDIFSQVGAVQPLGQPS
jgi:predicted ester cyclase